VEGIISDFHPKPAFGGGYESFRVKDVPFFYSDYESTPGFNRVTRNGGPMMEGPSRPDNLCLQQREQPQSERHCETRNCRNSKVKQARFRHINEETATTARL
jgi:hypothetical protein